MTASHKCSKRKGVQLQLLRLDGYDADFGLSAKEMEGNVVTGSTIDTSWKCPRYSETPICICWVRCGSGQNWSDLSIFSSVHVIIYGVSIQPAGFAMIAPTLSLDAVEEKL